MLNQSIKFLNKTAYFDLKIQKFREKLLNIHAEVEDLIFDLKSNEEIVELELLENKLVNNLEINNSIQSVLKNLNNFSHDEP